MDQDWQFIELVHQTYGGLDTTHTDTIAKRITKKYAKLDEKYSEIGRDEHNQVGNWVESPSTYVERILDIFREYLSA